MRLVLFGERPYELSNISYCIEHAFDAHRQRLVTIMEKLGTISQQLQATDIIYNNLYRSVHSRMNFISSMIPEYWEHNEMVLRDLIQPFRLPFSYGILQTPLNYSLMETSNSRNKEQEKDLSSYNSLVQVLIHINRDWTSGGAEVRQRLYYDGILSNLQKVLPSEGGDAKILVPGAGLARLAFDAGTLGYHVEANECSAAMLCSAYSIIDRLLPNGLTRLIYPTLHYPLQDDWDLELKLKSAAFPYIDDFVQRNKDKVQNIHQYLTFQYGDFGSIYKANDYTEVHKGRFDAILTCFFIDTGRSILEYLEVIKYVLKEGGVWINAGPLHYHNPLAVPYSYKDVIEIIKLTGFEVLHEEKIMMSYCGEEDQSMKPEMYAVPLAMFRKLSINSRNEISNPTTNQCAQKKYLDHPNYTIKR